MLLIKKSWDKNLPSLTAMSISCKSSSLRMELRNPSLVWFISDGFVCWSKNKARSRRQTMFIHNLPNSTSCRVPFCMKSFQRRSRRWSWSDACCWQRLTRDWSCSGAMVQAGMQFLPKTHCVTPQGENADGGGDGWIGCAVTSHFQPGNRRTANENKF